ncbi:hypothetical protein B5P44_27030 [Mycobacterium sp. CBMA 213]|nr:hypothetical protein [Mycolicibacterium sp. CBMA 213]
MGAGDVSDHIAASGAGQRIDQRGDDVDDLLCSRAVVQSCGRARCEGVCDQPAQPLVIGAVAAE